MPFFHIRLNGKVAAVRLAQSGGRRYVGHTIGYDQAPRRLCVRNDDLVALRGNVESFDEEVGRSRNLDFHRCAGRRRKTLADNVLPPLADIDNGMAVSGKAGALAPRIKFNGHAIGESHYVDLGPERTTHDVVERVFAVGTYVGPCDTATHQERRVGSIHPDFVQTGTLWVAGGIQDPAIGRGHWILRVIAVMANLA